MTKLRALLLSLALLFGGLAIVVAEPSPDEAQAQSYCSRTTVRSGQTVYSTTYISWTSGGIVPSRTCTSLFYVQCRRPNGYVGLTDSTIYSVTSGWSPKNRTVTITCPYNQWPETYFTSAWGV